MNKSTYMVTRFDVNDEFYVEVYPYTQDGNEYIGFTLCKNRYAINSFMFGILKKSCPEYEWERLIKANVDEYIDMFYEDMEALDGAYDSNYEISSSLLEAIEMHNEHVDKLMALGYALLEWYPNVDNTPVSKAFCEAMNGIIGNAIYLCCEANSTDSGKWYTTEDWHVDCE